MLTALARWELVGKQVQQESNLVMDLLQRLYDRAPLWEQYLDGSLEVHVHAQVRQRAVCIEITSERDFMEREDARHAEVHAYRQNLPVFGGVIDMRAMTASFR